MLSQLNNILKQFRGCFSYAKTFKYFCLVVVSFMLLKDSFGVTSIVRNLLLCDTVYYGLIHFFNSSAYNLDDLKDTWLKFLEKSPFCLTFKNRCILVGDHTKVPKEGKCMPAARYHHQESADFGKAPTIFGHHFGAFGILLSCGNQIYNAFVNIRIHEGSETILSWKGEEVPKRAPRLAAELIALSKKMKKGAYVLLDRDFFNVDTLTQFIEAQKAGAADLYVVGRARNNTTCQRLLTPEELEANKAKKKRGRPRKYADPVHLAHLFCEKAEAFIETTLADGYRFSYYSTIQEWHNLKILFILTVDSDGVKSIFYSTDLSLSAPEVVYLYRLRFKIEVGFNDLKHLMHGFSYHFWVKLTEKVKKQGIDNAPDELKANIIKCIERIECSVTLACIAQGILQLFSLKLNGNEKASRARYQRTYLDDNKVSLGQTKDLFCKLFPILLVAEPELEISKILREMGVGSQAMKAFMT